MSNPKRTPLCAFFLMVGLGSAVLGAAGCGSGSGASVTPSVNAPISSTNFITRTDEPTLSEDAKILATREATSAFVSLDAARAFDADLAKIRAAYPAVADVHALLNFDPKTLLLIVKPDAPFVSKWNASAGAPSDTADTDLTTGDNGIDFLLNKYHATRTTSASDFEGARYYVLRFAQSLNTVPIRTEWSKSSASVLRADTNGIIGSNRTDIAYSLNSAGEKVYDFQQGYGDCIAGCINSYEHIYTLHSDGTISEAVTGTPPAGVVLGRASQP